MKIIARGTFEGTNAELRSIVEGRVAAFKKALADHAKTTGVPAPREEDVIEKLARSDEPFEIEPEPREPEPPSAEVVAALQLEVKRQEALRALDEARLEAAAADPDAPEVVKEYLQQRAITPSDNLRG